ncbi:MAG TPA: pentapeptide repeat-containing protein [Rugosimonospora sp.]|nr:pentapeptide repeat-containing protein [Rugosimonospora sp.]
MTGERVVGEDWYGLDLSGQAHSGTTFVDLDLTESTSGAGLAFEDCVFHNAKFNAAEHTGAAFVNCTFAGCAFFAAVLVDCKFVGSSFDRCTFDQLVVRGGDWSFAGLPGADLRSASFTDVRMREVDLGGARLDGATVRGVDLSAATLEKVSFEGTDLRGSDLSAVDPLANKLRGAKITWQQAVTLATALGLDVRQD